MGYIFVMCRVLLGTVQCAPTLTQKVANVKFAFDVRSIIWPSQKRQRGIKKHKFLGPSYSYRIKKRSSALPGTNTNM